MMQNIQQMEKWFQNKIWLMGLCAKIYEIPDIKIQFSVNRWGATNCICKQIQYESVHKQKNFKVCLRRKPFERITTSYKFLR